jgi:hypothetical protein
MSSRTQTDPKPTATRTGWPSTASAPRFVRCAGRRPDGRVASPARAYDAAVSRDLEMEDPEVGLPAERVLAFSD